MLNKKAPGLLKMEAEGATSVGLVTHWPPQALNMLLEAATRL